MNDPEFHEGHPDIILEPELDACVETQAKRQYNQLLRELFTASDDDTLVERLETLQLFLESADFSQLRQESEKHLVAGKRVRFFLRRRDGVPEYEMRID